MAKTKAPKNPIQTREAYPKTRKTKTGVELLCPFCIPTHPILPGKITTCGTEIVVKAVQHLITARVARQEGIVCMKCHKNDSGVLASCMNGFVHTHDCAPGTIVLSSEPKYSKLAEKVYRLPVQVRNVVEKRMGEVKEIKEIDAEGKETGKILGYFFYKNDV